MRRWNTPSLPRQEPGQTGQFVLPCSLLFGCDIHACRFFLLILGCALGGDVCSCENAVVSQTAARYRGRSVDQRIWKGTFTDIPDLQRLGLLADHEVNDFAIGAALDCSRNHVA